MTAELSRLVRLARIPAAGQTVRVQATADECAALARRMDIPAVHALDCSFRLTRDGTAIAAESDLRAEVTRTCVISAEEFDTQVQESFRLRFVPAGTERDDPDPALDDEIPYYSDTLDLGEAAAEQLALALDPYPRMPGAVPSEIAPGPDVSPFAVLRRGGTDVV